MLRTERISYPLWLLIFLLTVLLLTASGRLAPQDEETTYRTTANLIEYGRWTITAQTIIVEPQAYPGFLPQVASRELLTTWAVPGRDGQLYPQFAPGQSLVAIPLYLIGRLFGGAPSLSAVLLTRFTTSLFNPILIALTGWLLALFAARLNFSPRLSMAVGLAYALGSMALPYTRTYFGEPLIAFMIVLAAYALYRVKAERIDRVDIDRWLLVSGSALAIAIFARERSAIMVPAFLIYTASIIGREWRRWVLWLLPTAIVGLLIGLMNWSRYGSPLIFGFSALQHTTFNTPLLLGLYGLLLSPGKGLLFYNPIVWAGLIGLVSMWRRRRAEAVLLILIIVAEIGFFAVYEFWTGGWNWGPRYILPIVPLLILAAGAWVQANPTRVRRASVGALIVIGVAVNLPAVVVDHSRYLVEFGERDPGQYLNRSILNMADSPLTQQWPRVFEMANLYAQPGTWAAAREAAGTQLQAFPGGTDLETISTRLMGLDEFFRLNVPDFWFIHGLLLGFPPMPIALSVLLLLSVTVVAGRRLIVTWRTGV
ncbi:MAG: hypothetical protein HY870_08630 [Chloroflexi bacterium]|nr:hypothetical protein [Chloroflexota bacterium]